MLDALLLARLQFAFTVGVHITFPALSIGLACFLAVLEWRWLKTSDPVYKATYLFWSRFFAIGFGMGVVTGVVLAYEIGTNWAGFARVAGNVTGPLLTYEVLTAFFLEAGFLGVMLFGWDRVSRRAHFFATLMVAAGTLASTFWILSSNMGGCERIASTPIPLAYGVLLHRTVYTYCVLLPFGLVDSTGLFTPVLCVFLAYTLIALEAISNEVADPFGTAPNALALDTMSRQLERAVLPLCGQEAGAAPDLTQAYVLT